MPEWRITDEEWKLLGRLLRVQVLRESNVGRPRADNDRPAAEACLFRHFHSLSPEYPCFGWNELPGEIGVSPSTANRRYREWVRSGAWGRFWQGLLQARQGQAASPWKVERAAGVFPAGDISSELERAYCFFAERFFGGVLSKNLAIILTRTGRRTLKGFYCPRLWTDGTRRVGQVAIDVSTLAEGVAAVLGTLLHEMVHLRNEQFGITDCHSRNQYHNRHFRDLAEVSGLSCGKRHVRLGYGMTCLNEQGRQAITDFRPDPQAFRWKPVV